MIDIQKLEKRLAKLPPTSGHAKNIRKKLAKLTAVAEAPVEVVAPAPKAAKKKTSKKKK
tara:strand:+ start:341 stop:517 length:177 start_codon:yes stop_codon:yes gene_type:complete